MVSVRVLSHPFDPATFTIPLGPTLHRCQLCSSNFQLRGQTGYDKRPDLVQAQRISATGRVLEKSPPS